jgi:hypothetical protein
MTGLARELVKEAHKRAAGLLANGPSYANPTPDSIGVLAMLRLMGCVASQRDTREACAAFQLTLADADPPKDPRP